MQLAGLILAGDSNRRIGGVDKAAVMLGDQNLLSWVSERFVPQVEAAVISTGEHTELAETCGLPVLPDMFAGELGPLAGLLAGLDWAAGQGADLLVTAAVDTPFLPCDLAPQLLLAADIGGCGAAIAASRDVTGQLRAHGTFGLWPVECRAELVRALKDGQRRMMGWAEAQGAAQAEFPVIGGMDPFFNINRPEDLALAERWLVDMSQNGLQSGLDEGSPPDAD